MKTFKWTIPELPRSKVEIRQQLDYQKKKENKRSTPISEHLLYKALGPFLVTRACPKGESHW
jgi:hypothetical protein